jgi:hypothetical protein
MVKSSSKEDEKKINDFIALINNPYYETGYDMMYLNRRALVVGPAFDQDNELTIEEEKKLSPSEIIDRTIHWFVYVVGLDNISELRWPYAIDAIDSPFENNVVHVVPKQNEDSESDTDVQHHHD